MKNLIDYLKECEFATPMNTQGLGNIMAPEGDTVGSGDLIGISKSTKKKRKNKKTILKNKV
jgi:hypothetical protein